VELVQGEEVELVQGEEVELVQREPMRRRKGSRCFTARMLLICEADIDQYRCH
jgi:hypothetical protein